MHMRIGMLILAWRTGFKGNAQIGKGMADAR